MLRLLFLLLLILPIAEIVVLVQVGQQLGFWATVALLVLAGIVGLNIMKWQGARMVQSVSAAGLSLGGGADMLSGVLLSLAGVLFLIPGFISDAVALLLLLPFTRSVLARWMLSKGMAGMTSAFGSNMGSGIRFGSFGSFSRTWSSGEQADSSAVFEGEFTREGQAQGSISLPKSTPLSDLPNGLPKNPPEH
jgi:UPF0716 protein FxsA